VKLILLSVFVALAGLSFVPGDAEAKRLGGGATSGMKRQTPPPTTPPANQAAPTPGNSAAAAAAPAAAAKRSWMGPIAGLAAGLGIAALMSHLGLGAEFGNILMMVLLGLVAFVAIRLLMKRFGRSATAQAPQGMQFAGAGAGFPQGPQARGFGSGSNEPQFTSPLQPVQPAVPAGPSQLPAGFDAAGFERIAKLIFIRMQAANDSADLEDLRQFATPEMFAAFRLDLQDRADSKQQTDVVQLNAQVLDVAEEPTGQVVSVRFHGLIREEANGPAVPFDEVWHLVKPADGSREWAIAGIAQSAA
jgi:predicted lipid-binding transport protein (Tim44 family)